MKLFIRNYWSGVQGQILMDDQQLFLQKLNRRTRFTQFLVWIALFFTAAGIAAGYKNWLRIHQKSKAGLAGVAEIREEIPSFAKKERILAIQVSVNEQLKNNTVEFDESIKELRQIQQSTKYLAETVQTQIEGIAKQISPSVSNNKLPVIQEWSLSEVRFLLQTAIHVLTFKQDKQGALTALKLADERILKEGSAELFPLRKQIAKDIARVMQYTLPDVSALSEQISILQKHIEPQSRIEKEIIPSTLKVDEKDQNSIISRVKKTINTAIVVRKFDRPLDVEMNIEMQSAFFQLLSLKLEALRIMLLQRQNKNYHKQLKSIKILLKKYYSESEFKDLKKGLNLLSVDDLQPEIPDISTSVKLFESILPIVELTTNKSARKKGE